MAQGLTAWVIAAVIVLSAATGNAQPAGSGKSGEGQEAISCSSPRISPPALLRFG
ncbi:MAG: hypothetical protein A4E69_02547 [Syntrophus sp. PtaB.Bin138]|nr:MAG: hypothetical protein A4E69_02547 [Syntrophus sp. PtaB.Bin138]